MFNRFSSSRACALASVLSFCAGLLTFGAAEAAGLERAPMNAQGEPIGSHLGHPSLSYDGRYMAFQSSDDGLTPDDDNGVSDVYVFDYETRALVRASGGFLNAFGAGASVHPAISSDGRFVAFASDSSALNLPMGPGQTVDVIDANGARDVFVYDMGTGATTAVSVSSEGRLLDAASDFPSISGDGRYVAFQSRGSTPGEPGGTWRIFVHDRSSGVTRMVSVDSLGRAARGDSERPSISADGRYVAFETDAALVAADTNGRRDVYRCDLLNGRVELVSASSTGMVGGAASRGASISADGSMVAFESGASNLVAGDTNLVPDVFVRDLRTGATSRVSVGEDGGQADGSSVRPAISADGSVVIFESYAMSLTHGDRPAKPEDAGQSNERSSVFMHSMNGGRTVMVGAGQSRGAARSEATRDGDPTISGDGTVMAFAELPLLEPPGGTIGGVVEGRIFRGGSCTNTPQFLVTDVEVSGVPQIGGPAMMATVNIRPRSTAELYVRLEATDPLSCDFETMEIALMPPGGGAALPAGMVYLKDGNACTDGGESPIATGVIAMADSDTDDDLAITLCWSPDVDDFLINDGEYDLVFIARFPGSFSAAQVPITINVLECDAEIDLIPNFNPGFVAGPFVDLNNDMLPDFLGPGTTPTSAGNRYEENAGGGEDIDAITMAVSETAEFDITFNAQLPGNGSGFVCLENGITELDVMDPPQFPYEQTPCTYGGATPKMPCFIEVISATGTSENDAVVVINSPTFPLLDTTFQAQIGWPAGEKVKSISLKVRVEPTALDVGNRNQVTFNIFDVTGHRSDPQLNFVILGCVEEPCCLIDQYQIEGVDAVVRTIPTEPLILPGTVDPVMCDGETAMQPGEDGILDVFPNQTLSFVVSGRLQFNCPGAVLTLEKDEFLGDVFPAGLVCVDQDGPDPMNQYVCLDEPGDPDSDIMSYFEWTPTPEDARTNPYRFVFRVMDNTGNSSTCFVRIRVCPEPVCVGTIAIDGGEPMALDFSNPQVPPTQIVTPGQTIALHICGTQDCGEFVEGGALQQGVYRTITIEPTMDTCQALCDLGCVSNSIDCGVMPPNCAVVSATDDPFVDSDNADGDNDNATGAEDPFEACYDVTCTIPELNQQVTRDLCFTITDASGKPVDCCVRLTVCPPVTCEPTNIVFNGTPAPMDFDPMTDTFTLIPGEDNLQFKVTGGGGCDGDAVRIDNIEVVCFDDTGAEIPVPACEQDDACCTLDLPCEFTDIFGAPVVFPFDCDMNNMCMVNVNCSFGADWYGLCDKILVRATVTSDPGGPNEQSTSCGVMVDIGQCPPPTCVVKNEMPELCTLTGDELDNAIVVKPGEAISFDVNFLSDCFGAKLKWSATGIPAWMDPHNGGVPADTFECPNFTIHCTGTPMEGDEGHYEVTFTVMDNTGQSSMCKVWIIVCDGPTCEIRVNDPMICDESGYIEACPGQKVDFDFVTSSPCPIEAFEGRPIIVSWSIKGDPLPGLVCTPAPPAQGVFVPLTNGVLLSECTWTPTAQQVGVYTVIINTMDNCGRMNECEITIRVCEKPKCLMTVMVNGSPATYDPNDPDSCVMMKPGEDLSVEICGMPGSADCNDLPLTLSLLSAPTGGPALLCNPVLPVMGMVDQQGMLCTTCTLEAGAADVSDTKYVWRFGIQDSCGRVSPDLCELRVLVMPCDPPTCEITSITVAGEAFDFTGMEEKPLVPILPGQELVYTVKGTLGCADDDIDLDLLCDMLPTGAMVQAGDKMVMDKVTMREWTVSWTPKVTDDYCDTQVDFNCQVVATPDGVASGSDLCLLNADVGQCPAPNCTISDIEITRDGVVMTTPLGSDCIAVQPGDLVKFTVQGRSKCPDGAMNALTIVGKQLDLFPPNATMTPALPVTGEPDALVESVFMWTPTLEQCGDVYEARFFISQECGPDSVNCGVCFTVGICDTPPLCELSEFMVVPNPDMCFIKGSEDAEEICLDLPFEVVPDGYMINVFPGDKVKLKFCGKTECICTTLTLDADGLPEGSDVFCDLDGDGTFEPDAFPCIGDPYPVDGMPGFRQLCSRVEFTVPPAGSFHITFTVSDSDDETADAVCVLWVEVEDVCDDFEPNDECELPQEIDSDICGPYLSGLLEMRCTPGCQPDTFMVLFNKQNQVIAMNNNGSHAGNGKASGLYDITAANGLSPGNGSDLWLRIGVSGYPDGLGGEVFNGFHQNGPHGQLGEFKMTVTFYDGNGEIISPAIVQDSGGHDVVVDNPFVYENRFETGAEAFRLNFQGPRALQGGGTTASASIEIDNTTGQDPLCDDVDFFKYTGLVPLQDYCIVMVGGYSKDCTPLNAQLGWFDKKCDEAIVIDCDSGPAGYPQICTTADANGEIIIGVTGKGDDDFDGYLTPPAPDGRAVDGCPDPAGDHGVCGCYTLCIMPFDPHGGVPLNEPLVSAEQVALEQAMHHGDMNQDGRTDTADLGLLMGRFGWTAESVAAPATGQQKAKKTPSDSGKALGGVIGD
ncbi:MAG: PD40 domain-containing protein [Phycisphaeraceae bacterium]|nr:PD40 domain-containing protein [Phycisphaeraceae bacterium]